MIKPRLLFGLLAIVLAAVVVSGCGRKAAPEPKDPSSFPRTMPAPPPSG